MDGKKRKKSKHPIPTQLEIGRTLAQELGEIIDELGEDHPDLNSHMLRYIGELNERHPAWGPVMERARDRQLRRIQAHNLKCG